MSSRSNLRVVVLAGAVAALALGIGALYLEPHFPALRLGANDPWFHHYAVDEATFLHNATRMAKGEVLYRDYFDFKGPVAYWLMAWLPPKLVVGRAFMVLVMALWTLLQLAVGRAAGLHRAGAAGLALVVPLLLWPMWPYAYQDFFAQLFATGAALAVVASRRKRAWGLAGVAAALAFWTSLAQGALVTMGLLAASLVIASGEGRERGRFSLALVFGAAWSLVSAAILAVFVAQGALVPAMRAIFVFPLTRYGAANATLYAMDLPRIVGNWKALGLPAQVAVWWTCVTVAALPILGVIAALVIIPRALADLRRRGGEGAGGDGRWRVAIVVGALGWTGLPVVLSRTRSDLCHIGFVGGTAVLAVVGVWSWWVEGRSQAARRWLARGMIGVSVLTLGLAGWLLAYGATRSFERVPWSLLDEDACRRFDCAAVRARTDPSDGVLALPYSGMYNLLTGRPNPTRFSVMVFEGAYSAPDWPLLARDLARTRPAVILASGHHVERLVGIEPGLSRSYQWFGGGLQRRDPVVDVDKWVGTRWGLLHKGTTSVLEVRRHDEGLAAVLERGGERREVEVVFSGQRLMMHDGKEWIATLSPDGQSGAGTVFPDETAFSLRRLKAD